MTMTISEGEEITSYLQESKYTVSSDAIERDGQGTRMGGNIQFDNVWMPEQRQVLDLSVNSITHLCGRDLAFRDELHRDFQPSLDVSCDCLGQQNEAKQMDIRDGSAFVRG